MIQDKLFANQWNWWEKIRLGLWINENTLSLLQACFLPGTLALAHHHGLSLTATLPPKDPNRHSHPSNNVLMEVRKLLRGVIFKIQPLRNPSIFNNMICVPISKVLLKGMSNHPHFEIFWTSSKIWRIRIFFQNSKFHVRKNCCWWHQWAIYQ